MMQYDYSIYYARFHDGSEEHARKMGEYFAALLVNDVPPLRSARVLDVGCGYGFALRGMRGLGFGSLEGLEASPQQAEKAKLSGFDVHVVSSSIEWLATKQESYDCVLLLDVLEHVPVDQQIDMLAAIHSCLAPGGRVIVTTPNANAILAARWRYNDFTHHSSFTEHSLFFVLRNAGFERISLDAEKGLGRFPRRLWRRSARRAARKWIVRWCWLQVFKAELPWEKLDDISFELNLKAVAYKA